jgi:hypothetical protein
VYRWLQDPGEVVPALLHATSPAAITTSPAADAIETPTASDSNKDTAATTTDRRIMDPEFVEDQPTSSAGQAA